MERFKRSKLCHFELLDVQAADLAALLEGRVVVSETPEIRATSLLTGRVVAMNVGELGVLAGISSERWQAKDEIVAHGAMTDERLGTLVATGLLLSDADDPDRAALRRRHEHLESAHWHPAAAYFHFVNLAEEGARDAGDRAPEDPRRTALADARRFIAKHGPPPPAFFERAGAEEPLELPLEEGSGGLYSALSKRRTWRTFDTRRPMALDDLSVLLRYAFGCHGYHSISPEFLTLHKTSPSGGSLHPIEAYPLIVAVEGVESGLYHYRTADHCLDPVRRMTGDEARELAIELAQGQQFVGRAHTVVLLVARFLRNFWKYRQRANTYGVVLEDAGHLSQTFHLVATDLGLGAFYTGAIQPAAFVRELGLNDAFEGPIGLCGCGLPAQRDDASPELQPYVPRESTLPPGHRGG